MTRSVYYKAMNFIRLPFNRFLTMTLPTSILRFVTCEMYDNFWIELFSPMQCYSRRTSRTSIIEEL